MIIRFFIELLDTVQFRNDKKNEDIESDHVQCPQYTGSPLLNSDYEGSKINLLSKIWILFEKTPKVEFFKKSEKNFVISKMEQNPSNCSIWI